MQKSKILRFFEKIIEGILAMSSTATSLAVLLIVIFLFKEGLGIFGQTPIEKNFVVAVNKSNKVSYLSQQHIKDIFDAKVTNWKELGGIDANIKLFTVNDIATYFTEEQIGANFERLPSCLNKMVATDSSIIAYLPSKYVNRDFTGNNINIEKITVANFLGGKEWFPTAQPVSQFGVLPMILGTLIVCLGAIGIALPLGLSTAIYMSEVADTRIRNTLKPVIELLAGIPSVVYGFFGLIIIVPMVQKVFNLPVGETGLSGSIILAIMVLPTIITISEDAMRNTPNSLKEASLALGATQWQTIYKVIIPHSRLGITAGVILGIGRAFGETMAVLMVTGNAAVMPHSILQPMRTLTATIAAELGEASQGGLHYKALFALGCLLFLITLSTNMVVEMVSAKQKK